jgi:hypothetical protein
MTSKAQSDTLRFLYQSSATISTNLEGVHAYPTPPAGFDPLAASDEELAAYGIPLRPDKTQDPDGYRHWTRVAQLVSNPRGRYRLSGCGRSAGDHVWGHLGYVEKLERCGEYVIEQDVQQHKVLFLGDGRVQRAIPPAG